MIVDFGWNAATTGQIRAFLSLHTSHLSFYFISDISCFVQVLLLVPELINAFIQCLERGLCKRFSSSDGILFALCFFTVIVLFLKLKLT